MFSLIRVGLDEHWYGNGGGGSAMKMGSKLSPKKTSSLFRSPYPGGIRKEKKRAGQISFKNIFEGRLLGVLENCTQSLQSSFLYGSSSIEDDS